MRTVGRDFLNPVYLTVIRCVLNNEARTLSLTKIYLKCAAMFVSCS